MSTTSAATSTVVEAPAQASVRHCINCVQPLPHVGTSWKESGACRRNENGGAYAITTSDETSPETSTETGGVDQ